VHFRVWAPGRRRVELCLEPGAPAPLVRPLEPGPDGYFHGFVPGATAGQRYRYRLDGDGPFPDPASRFQPDGVHGPSGIVDPRRYQWDETERDAPDPADLVIYELHLGTFTPAGTFRSAIERLPALSDLGVTAIELMPVADFPGRWNWGYDGAALFAPARCYGPPDDLRALVAAAHHQGLAVLLDVVYNHLGPDGAYVAAVSPAIFSDRHRTPWGRAINLDGTGSRMVRDFLVENAIHWLAEYRFDGLRLDATHALVDDSPRHFLAELAQRVRAAVAPRRVLLFAEDHRNLARIARPASDGGWGFDGIWSDDFHHEVRRALAGDRDGYYADFTGSMVDLATTVRQGWFFTGQPSAHFGGPRGTDPSDLAPRSFVICLQNHDQVGNRALGERLNHQIEPAAWRAASALLLLAPETPLLFMGQEWAASTPFLFFTDHHPELGRLVTSGRREEFRGFRAFTDPEARGKIPDPQDPATVRRSRLDWSEPTREPHLSARRLYRALLALRRSEPLLRRNDWRDLSVAAADGGIILARRGADAALLALIRLEGAGDLDGRSIDAGEWMERLEWEVLLTTEDPAFAPDAAAPSPRPGSIKTDWSFLRPGAVVLRGRLPGSAWGRGAMP
jgi:maltooligosyltrehalose trehalohydrolase